MTNGLQFPSNNQRVNRLGQPIDAQGNVIQSAWAGGSNVALNDTGNYMGEPSGNLVPNIDTARVGGTTPQSSGFGLNLDTVNMAGNVMGGVGSLAKGWAALKGIGIAKDQLAENQRQYNQNYAAQRTTVNNQIRDRQALLNSAFYNSPDRAKALQVVQ